jgi:hypothetical protein
MAEKMRVLLNIRFPHKEFNAAVRDGTANSKIKRILDDIKPEAAYFTDQRGQRGMVMVVKVADSSEIPAIAEPFFLLFAADVEFHVAMKAEDLKKAGLDKLGKKWA